MPSISPASGKATVVALSFYRHRDCSGIVLEQGTPVIQNRAMDDDTLYRGLRLERHEWARNLHRAYGLRLARSLFGHWGLVRQWGRVGRPGSTKTEWFPGPADAEAAFARKLKEKTRRGYRLRRPFGRADEH